jgi:hypothetical protein
VRRWWVVVWLARSQLLGLAACQLFGSSSSTRLAGWSAMQAMRLRGLAGVTSETPCRQATKRQGRGPELAA